MLRIKTDRKPIFLQTYVVFYQRIELKVFTEDHSVNSKLLAGRKDETLLMWRVCSAASSSETIAQTSVSITLHVYASLVHHLHIVPGPQFILSPSTSAILSLNALRKIQFVEL